MSFLTTHSTHLIVVTLIVGYLYLPVGYWLWLKKELERGAFPVNADTIMIPMMGFLFCWMVTPIGVIAAFAVAKFCDRYRNFK